MISKYVRSNLNASMVFMVLVFMSCMTENSGDKGTFVAPDDLMGVWMDSVVKVTVRTEPKLMKFEFTKDIASINMEIFKDGTVTGNIGQASFQGQCRHNSGNPEKTGIAYIIECGRIGKIFDRDPLEEKEVEIWLSTVKGQMGAELRFTEGGAKFPMAGMIFSKKMNNKQ
jgi:hypothetical protein